MLARLRLEDDDRFRIDPAAGPTERAVAVAVDKGSVRQDTQGSSKSLDHVEDSNGRDWVGKWIYANEPDQLESPSLCILRCLLLALAGPSDGWQKIRCNPPMVDPRPLALDNRIRNVKKC